MNATRTIVLLSVIGLLVCGAPAPAQTTEDLVVIRKAFADALDSLDLDSIMSYFADDAVVDMVIQPPPYITSEGIRGFFDDQFKGSPDWRTDEGRVLATGNIVVVEHAVIGTQTGIWEGISSGNPWQFPHLDIYEFEGNKIKKLTTYGDYAGVLIQLGLLPVPDMPDFVPSIAMPAHEPTGLSPLEANADHVRRWNSHDAASMAKIYHADCTIFAGPLGMELDRVAMTAMNEMFFTAFPDVELEVVRTIGFDGDWVLTELVSRATHQGTFFGMPPMGYATNIRAVWLTRYAADGLVIEGAFYYDNLTLMTQIMPKAPEWPGAPDYLIWDEIYSPSLEGNLLGDPATRPLLIYLPPSYETSPEKRYPTVYLLHGFIANEQCFTSAGISYALHAITGMDFGGDVGTVAAGLMEADQMDELIIVLVNGVNSFGGSMYERSVLIGDYRDYIAKDLVAYVDTRYRTIADNSARGIAGHSMGGYGALSLAMEYPAVFGAVAAMSPGFCDMEKDTVFGNVMTQYPLVPGLPVPGYTPDDMWNIFLGYFDINLLYALGAAWTPNLDNPPFYVDLPVQYPGPSIATDIWEKWKERDLVRQVQRHGANLSGKPLFIDEGRGPTMLMAELSGIDSLLAALHAQGLSYTYNAFDGDHLTHFGYQLASALKFLSAHVAR